MSRFPARLRRLIPPAAVLAAAATVTALATGLQVPASASASAHLSASTPAATGGRIWFVDGSTGQLVSTTPTGADRTTLAIHASHPAVSPDGTRIAYELPTLNGIAVVNADGTGQQTLVHTGGWPSWSPDGTRIVYSDGADIAVVTVATKAVTYLTHDGAATEEVSPAWSPNGTWIAFTERGCDPDGGGRCVVRIDAATGGNRVVLTPYQGETDTSDEADWSPSNTLAYSSGGCAGGGINVWTMSATGSNKTDLTCDVSHYNSDTAPTWAPSGSQIAFVSDERVDPDYDQLYLVSPTGSGLTYVDTGSRFGLADPDWAAAVATQSTSLTLAASPTSVSAGQKVTLSGRLTPASGQPYAGQKVAISAAASGAARPAAKQPKPKTVLTAADGSFSLKVKATQSTTYQASYAANPTLGLSASTSPSVTVTVH